MEGLFLDSLPSRQQAERNLFDQFGVRVETRRFDTSPTSLEKRGVTSQAQKPIKSTAEQAQSEFWERLSVYSEGIVAKLDGCGRRDLADMVRDCHSEVSYRRCRGCSEVSKFYNRCEVKWCPLCAPRLSRERKTALAAWVGQVKRPRHLVLTVRNSKTLTKSYVKWFKACFSKLRRTKLFSSVRGGFYSLEVTNESRGWHLHLHALIDSEFIDQSELAKEWARIVGQDFAIVYLTSKADTDYTAEVAKYVVKGSELAKWSGEEIAAFVDAFTGVRTFSAFGSLLGERAKVKAIIAAILDVKPACECGCTDFHIMNQNELEEFQLTRRVTFRQFPPRPQQPAAAPPQSS